MKIEIKETLEILKQEAEHSATFGEVNAVAMKHFGEGIDEYNYYLDWMESENFGGCTYTIAGKILEYDSIYDDDDVSYHIYVEFEDTEIDKIKIALKDLEISDCYKNEKCDMLRETLNNAKLKLARLEVL